MIKTRLAITVAAVLCVTAATAQTHSETLEKGIFTEETAGDLDGAIRIYEGLLRAPGVPRAIAARAQARLSVSRQRQDLLAHAAAQHSRDPRPTVAEALPASAAPVSAQVQRVTDGCCGMFSGNYDPARAVTVTGTVTAVEWVNPQSVVYVAGADGNLWGFTIGAPNMMIRAGMNRNSLRLGEQVLIYAYLAKGTGQPCPGQLPNACATFMNGAVHASASTITGSDGKTIFDRITAEQLEQRRLEEQERTGRAVDEIFGRAGTVAPGR